MKKAAKYRQPIEVRLEKLKKRVLETHTKNVCAFLVPDLTIDTETALQRVRVTQNQRHRLARLMSEGPKPVERTSVELEPGAGHPDDTFDFPESW